MTSMVLGSHTGARVTSASDVSQVAWFHVLARRPANG
jgi:hypothetical protein